MPSVLVHQCDNSKNILRISYDHFGDSKFRNMTIEMKLSYLTLISQSAQYLLSHISVFVPEEHKVAILKNLRIPYDHFGASKFSIVTHSEITFSILGLILNSAK